MNYTRATTAALAAALLLGQAQSALADDPVPTYNDAVIFGKVTIAEGGDANDPSTLFLSVTIPATEGAVDAYGNPTTIWNLGTVMAGGVYDSFYNGGPGHFRVQNTGNYPAYVYVSTGWGVPKFTEHQGQNSSFYGNTAEQLFGIGYPVLSPVSLPKFMDQDDAYMYALAVSTEITGPVPAWRPLSWFYDDGDVAYYNGADATSFDGDSVYTFQTMGAKIVSMLDYSAYLGYIPVGETQLFDLKFWAPLSRVGNSNTWFRIRIEASAFKLWDHDR